MNLNRWVAIASIVIALPVVGAVVVNSVGIWKAPAAVDAVKSDVSGIKSDVAALKVDVASVKADVSGVKADSESMKFSLVRVNAKLDVLLDRKTASRSTNDYSEYQ